MPRGLFRTAATTTEQLVVTGRVMLWTIIPDLTTTGTVTLRDGAAADGAGTTKHLAAIGMTQVGKDFKGGVFNNGLTVQQSVASDLCTIVYEKF